MITDPNTINTPIDAFNAAIEELNAANRDIMALRDDAGAAPDALMTIWYVTEVVKRLRDNVALRVRR